MRSQDMIENDARIRFFRSIRGQLLISFLLLSLIPLIVMALVAFISAQNSLRDSIQDSLVALAETRALEVESWVSGRTGDVAALASSPGILGDSDPDTSIGISNIVRYRDSPENAEVYQEAYDTARAELLAVVNSYDRINDTAIVSLEGEVLVSATGIIAEGSDVTGEAYFTEARNLSSGAYFTDILLDASGAPVMVVTRAIADEEGQPLGVAVLHVLAQDLGAILTDRTGLSDTGETYLVNSELLMISQSRFSTESTILSQQVDTVGVREAFSSLGRGIADYDNYRDVLVVGAWRYIPAQNWVMMAEIDLAEAYIPIQQLAALTVGIMIAVAIIVLIIAFFIARTLATPIIQMVGVARQIAAGDLTRRVGLVARNEVGVLGRSFDDMTENLQTMLETERARKTVLERTVSDYLSFVEQVTSGDLAARLRTTVDDGEQETVDEELFRLAENLNTMAANLDGMVRREQDARSFLENTVTAYMHFVRQVADGDLTVRLALEANAKQDGDDDLYQLGVNLNAMVESLSDMARQVRETASSVSAAASEIQAVTAEQMASAVQQDATITETVATVEAVRATVAQTAERAGAVTRSSQQSVEVSRAGQEAVADSMEGMRAIQMRVVDIAENILLLSERTQQIGEIIETVNALAAQSKLLALNASIEAARAGEEGKGFAVVAMEVRQLAEQSRESTERVRDILNEIQQATNTAVMVTEEGSKDAETGITLVERAGVTIHELAGALEEAAQSAMQISASANQQTNGMDQLSAAMAEIKQASTQTAASTQQAERSMRDLLDTARQLEEAAARYKL